MGTYTSSTCGRCNFSFSNGYSHGNSAVNNFGLPALRCPKCKTINKTENNIYSMMDRQQKRFFWLIRGINVVMYGIASATVIPSLAYMFGYITKADTGLFISTSLAAFLIAIALNYILVKNEIAKLERIYVEKDPEFYADV